VKLAELAQWRADLASYYAGHGVAARIAGLASPIEHFGLAQQDFDAIIDGMVMDAEADIRAPDWPMLDLYCDRVASAVGRHCVRIFRIPEERGGPLAHHLGRALQLTNILRDLDEDAALGRLYVPRTVLVGAGITETEPLRVMLHPNIGVACIEVVARARNHFAEAGQIMDSCPRATVRSPRLMASVYRRILDELAVQGFVSPRKRVRLRKSHVLWAVLRHSLF
jgi:phytoene synthase